MPHLEESGGWQPGRAWRVTVLAVLVLVGIGYLLEAWQLEAGTVQHPDIGLYPRVAGLVFTVFLAVVLAGEVRASPAVTQQAGSWLKPVAILGTLLFYVVVATTLGHILSGAVVLAVVLRLAGQRSWWKIALLAAACSLLTYVVIGVLLEMPLPAGELGLEF